MTLMNSRKTIEGSLGFFVGSMLGYAVLISGGSLMMGADMCCNWPQWPEITLGCAMATLLEACSVQNDNLVLSLWGFVFFSR